MPKNRRDTISGFLLWPQRINSFPRRQLGCRLPFSAVQSRGSKSTLGHHDHRLHTTSCGTHCGSFRSYSEIGRTWSSHHKTVGPTIARQKSFFSGLSAHPKQGTYFSRQYRVVPSANLNPLGTPTVAHTWSFLIWFLSGGLWIPPALVKMTSERHSSDHLLCWGLRFELAKKVMKIRPNTHKAKSIFMIYFIQTTGFFEM